MRSPARVLASALIVIALGVSPALAHDTPPGGTILGSPGHDRPGPPPIITRVTLTTVEHPDMDDGGGDAEVTLTIAIQHAGHGTVTTSVTEPDLNFDVTGGTWTVDQELYSHRECTPMEEITITITGFEADATNLDALEATLLGIVSSLLEETTIGADTGLLAKLVGSVLATINPDDTLGSGSASSSGPGTASGSTSGGDYSITANFSITTEVVDGAECDPDSIPPEDPDPPFCHQSLVYFDPLIQAWDDPDLILVEPGDPGNVTPTDLADARTALRSLIRGMAQWASVRVVEHARGLSGFGTALSQYQSASLNPGLGSISLFRSAYCSAKLAMQSNIPDPNAPPMPPRAVAVPEMIATRAGRTVEYLIGVFGDNAIAHNIVNVSGGPIGTTFQLLPADPHHPEWRLLSVSQNGPPGTYPVHVLFGGPAASDGSQAESGPGVPSLVLLLDIDDSGATTIDTEPANVAKFALQGVAPNPLSGSGTVRVDLAEPAIVSLAIYDVAGRKVRDIVRDASFARGQHTFVVDTGAAHSGVYYVKMQARGLDGTAVRFEASEKFVVTR